MTICNLKSRKDSHHGQDYSRGFGVDDPYSAGAWWDLGACQCSRCHRSANNVLAAAGRFASVRSPWLVDANFIIFALLFCEDSYPLGYRKTDFCDTRSKAGPSACTFRVLSLSNGCPQTTPGSVAEAC